MSNFKASRVNADCALYVAVRVKDVRDALSRGRQRCRKTGLQNCFRNTDRASGCGRCQASGCGLRAAGCGLQAAGFGLRAAGCGQCQAGLKAGLYEDLCTRT
jgi:hypothetical protein